jgi:shikimate dehydrogenase
MYKFAVIGHPVKHSLSPMMHKANFNALSLEGSYDKFDVAEGNLEDFVFQKIKEGFSGLNVTIPYKRDVIKLLDKADPLVKDTGSCNTLKFKKDGTIEGYNTDVEGFFYSLSQIGFSLQGSKMLLIGCGGAGQSIALAAAKRGVQSIALSSRSSVSIDALNKKIIDSGFDCDVVKLSPDTTGSCQFRSENWGGVSVNCDLIVNASPIGLGEDDESVLSSDCFAKGQVFLDIIPVRRRTSSVSAALAAGARAIDGLDFLVEQGAKSFEIWTGLKAERSVMIEALRKNDSKE